MVSDTSLTTWNGLTQPACFSRHHFRWHFSLHLSVLYIQHSVKWFLEPLQPHQPCGGGGWAGGSSGEEKATACRVHVFALSMHYRSSFNHPASVKWILKVPHQPFSPLPHQALTGVVLLQQHLWNYLGSKPPAESQILEGACDPGDVWCRQCSAPSSSSARLPVCPGSILPADTTLTHSPLQSLHTPLPFPLLFLAASQQRAYQRPHLLNELKGVASAQNLPSPSQLPLLSNFIISITPSSPQLPDCCWNGWGNLPFQSKEKILLRTFLFPPLFCQKWRFW